MFWPTITFFIIRQSSQKGPPNYNVTFLCNTLYISLICSSVCISREVSKITTRCNLAMVVRPTTLTD